MKFSRAAGGLALLIVALPSLVGPVDAGFLLPLTAVSVGTGALATLGLLGAVGIGIAIKKSLYFGHGRGYGHSHHYHSHHHTGGGYGGGHTGGGYGGGHTGGGYGGAHTGGGYGGGHTGGGYGGAHSGGGYGTSYGGGSTYYPSPTYAAPLSSHRRRRSLPVETLVDNEQIDVDDLVSEDRLGCAQRLVCELAVRPIESLQKDELAVLALASAKTPKPGMKQLAKAAEEGKGKNSCSLLYKNCPFSAQQIMEIVRTVAEDY